MLSRDEMVEALLAATREGPAAGWCNRLAAWAALAGLDPADVAWCKPPRIVAHEVVSLAERRRAVEGLRRVLDAGEGRKYGE